MPPSTTYTKAHAPAGSRSRIGEPARNSTSDNIRIKRQSIYGLENSSAESLCAPRYKKLSCFAGVASQSSSEAMTKNPVPLMDPHDFDSLPPAIRRKYFSPLERLRYAQQPVTSKPAGHTRNASTTSGRLRTPRIKNRPSIETFRSTKSAARNKFPKHRNAVDPFEADAQWFLNLPETIQRKHFSPEERLILSKKCESMVADAVDDKSKGRKHRSMSLDSGEYSYSDAGSPHTKPSDSGIRNAQEELRRSFGWLDDNGELDLKFSQFDDGNSNAGSPPRTRKRRTLSISSRCKADVASSSTSVLRKRASFASRRTTSAPTAVPMATCAPSLAQKTSEDTEAAYYQDPEARLKLRVYLASPQKFDEAIEFGFPALAKDQECFDVQPKASTVGRIDLEYDGDNADLEVDSIRSVSAVEDVPRDADALPAILDDEDVEGVLHARSSESSSAKGRILNRYLYTASGSREMTLRMTLTRKDLRADEDTLYGWQKERAAPLEEFPPSGDAYVVDKLPAGSSHGFRKLWKKMKSF